MKSASFLVLLASAALLEARSMHQHQHRSGHLHGVAERAVADSTTLAADAIQSGSFVDGASSIGANVANQAPSLTSTNNFINNCAGKTLQNGLQILTGSCNGIPMGDIPAKTNMISSIITFPLAGSSDIVADTTFTISVQTQNLVAGFFTNADATYYSAPQQLQNGNVIGHTHVTVQDMGPDMNPTTALDPTKFAFFKGINDAGNNDGLLSANVTGGLPAGNYRVCTLTSAANHQPVLMPVAQRGTVDDCTKFTVTGSGSTINSASNAGAGGIAAAAAAASAVAAGPGAVVSEAEVATSAKASTSAKAASTLAGASSSSICTIVTGTVTVTRGAAKTSAAAVVAVAATSTTSAKKAIKTANGKKPQGNGKSQASGSTTVITTIITTFFNFSGGKGGSCPEVSKSGGKFSVEGELFADLAKAAAAACGKQFTACISFTGDGFTEEICETQKDSCASAAATQSATASVAETITASIVIPATTTLSSTPGSVVAVSTVASAISSGTAVATADAVTIATATSSVIAVGQAVATASATLGGATASTCGVVTSIITVEAPTATVAAAAASSSPCGVVTGTVTVTAPAVSSATIVSSSVSPFSNGTVARRHV